MHHPYKDDRQLEEELREADHGRTIVKRLCFPPSNLYERFLKEEDKHLPVQIAKSLFKKMEMQERQIKYLLETVEILQQNKELEQPKVVIVEEISKEEGKTLVEEYFKVHEFADIEELMLNLKIPVRSIVEIIDEMQKEGKLALKGENET